MEIADGDVIADETADGDGQFEGPPMPLCVRATHRWNHPGKREKYMRRMHTFHIGHGVQHVLQGEAEQMRMI
eukprot:6484472-Amphidinium_carterae.1